jgi:signal peptidase II
MPKERARKTLFVRCCIVVCLVAGTVGCDGVTKHLAAEKLAGVPVQSFLADTLRLSYVENAGGFLSLGETLPESVRTTVFTVLTGAFLLLLAGAAWRSGWQGPRTIALSLFVAGGFCNWVDRLGDGTVVDFLNVGIGAIRTGVFNVADMAIVAGIAVFLWAEWRRAKA